MNTRIWTALTAAAALAVALTGCGSAAEDAEDSGPAPAKTDSPAETDTPDPTQAPTPTETLSPTFDDGQLDHNVQASVKAVNEFWYKHWHDWFTDEYEPPAAWGGDGFYTDSEDGPECSGDPAADENAFYCTSADYVAWSRPLLEKADPSARAWPFLVVAHEWGHAIQHQEPDIVVNGEELQADCFAAAALYGSVEDGTTDFDTSDEKVITAALTYLADDTAWTTTKDHGSPLERIKWFTYGKDSGVPGCFPDGD